MKWILYIALLAGCGGCGFVYADELRRRIDLLQQLKSAWQTLHTRIQYFADPLQQALKESAELVSDQAKALFLHVTGLLQNGFDIRSAMAQSLEEIVADKPIYGCLKDKDKQALLSFAERLGSDSNTQKASFAFMDGYLNEEIASAQQRFHSHARLYRASGLLFGMLLVVLFW